MNKAYVSPQVEAASKSTRSEAEVRELARAKIKALEAYEALGFGNVADMTEEQRIDLEIKRARLWAEVCKADAAFRGAV